MPPPPKWCWYPARMHSYFFIMREILEWVESECVHLVKQGLVIRSVNCSAVWACYDSKAGLIHVQLPLLCLLSCAISLPGYTLLVSTSWELNHLPLYFTKCVAGCCPLLCCLLHGLWCMWSCNVDRYSSINVTLCYYSCVQELNQHLANRIFMIGYKLCLADILLYYGLHKYLVTW